MVLRRGLPERALVVPDEETWLACGAGSAPAPLQATLEPARARVLVLPEHVPDGLSEAVRSAWARMPRGASVQTYRAPLRGRPALDVLREEPPPPSGDEEEHEGHDDEHKDMMAITGEPSADGLVMEPIDVEAGPLGVGLAGGVVVEATLDGDVVADCRLRAALRQDEPPDVWSAVAWSVAELAAQEGRAGVAARPEGAWLRLAAVEVERAVGHLCWLHRFTRLLGWAALAARLRELLAGAVSARAGLPTALATPDLPAASPDGVRAGLARTEAAVRALAEDLSASRMLARRTRGLGHVDADEVEARGLTGPIARASGVAADARADDPGYRALGFAPCVREEGDARARTLLRVAEVSQAAALAADALDRVADGAAATPAFRSGAAGLVESARGPVRAIAGPTGHVERSAPGARAARELAGALACGREWAAALVTVASFDLSPWRLGP